MGDASETSPLSQSEHIDRSFMEHRHQVISIAAFFDRLERAAEQDAEDDFRLETLRRALEILTDGEGDYAERVQMEFSDEDLELLERRDRQDALGAARSDD